MASITFAIDDKLKSRMETLSWINWSEVARSSVLKRATAEQLLKRLDSKEEKEFTKWAVELGRKSKKGRFKRLQSKPSPKEKKELFG
ncbi:hypothetical protein GOV09_05730 [Candidatus Woesearchaeota archaeon]|nr:hypothetical protein [Candidatus Woesearchaeota archaeon]